MLRDRAASIGIGIILLLAHSMSAAAGMGAAPVGPKGTYVSFDGGYLHYDGADINGHGVSSVTGGPIQDVLVSPDNGYFLGGLIGFNTGTPFIGGFHRIESYLLYGNAEDSASNSVPPFADIILKSVDGGVLITTGGLKGTTSVERETWEWGIRLADDDVVNSTTTVTWVLAPFIRTADESTRTRVHGCCILDRHADVETWLYGAYVASEPQLMIMRGIAVVGRIGVGIYGYDADGDFHSSASTTPDPFIARVSDGDMGVGFRGLLGAGLKLNLGRTANIELFSEADYFSDVGTAHIANNQRTGGDRSFIDTDDLWELRSGLRLTIGFGSEPPYGH